MGRAKVTFRYETDFEPLVLSSPWMAELLEDLARKVSAAARRLAPRLLGFVIEGIDYEVGHNGPTGGLSARVKSSDFKSAWHEFGTRKMHPHPFLRPALQQELPGATITGVHGRPEYR